MKFPTSLRNRLIGSLMFLSPANPLFADSFIRQYFSDNQGERVDVLVNHEIYPDLDSILVEYAKRLEEDGFNVANYSCDVSSAESLKSFLQNEWQTDSITGAFLVGHFPEAWFQYVTSPGGGSKYRYFPTETFLKELDGTWLDTLEWTGDSLIPGSDSIYDTHFADSGDIITEIKLGRLEGNLDWNPLSEVELLDRYFERNIALRDSSLVPNRKVLMYFDDQAADNVDTSGVKLAYDDITVISDSNATTADDYKQIQLTQGYEWIWIAAHSTARTHTFWEANGDTSNTIYSSEIPNINPQTQYYFVNGCFSGAFIVDDFMLGHYVLSSDKGLAAIGFTGTGYAPIAYEDFWNVIANKGSVGEALKAHIDSIFVNEPGPPDNYKYAMTCIGDPTLKPKKDYSGIEEEEIARSLEYIIKPSNIVGNAFYVDFDNTMANPQDFYLAVYDVAGREVISKKFLSYYQNTGKGYKVSVKDLKGGVYFNLLYGDLDKDGKIGKNERKTMKIIIMR